MRFDRISRNGIFEIDTRFNPTNSMFDARILGYGVAATLENEAWCIKIKGSKFKYAVYANTVKGHARSLDSRQETWFLKDSPK
jgi:hypothetical protein